MGGVFLQIVTAIAPYLAICIGCGAGAIIFSAELEFIVLAAAWGKYPGPVDQLLGAYDVDTHRKNPE